MSRISVKNIAWVRKDHGQIGYVTTRGGRRRVASVYNENENWLRPKAAPPVEVSWSLEIHLPVLVGKPKIMKFDTEQLAKAEAGKQLAQFVADVADILED